MYRALLHRSVASTIASLALCSAGVADMTMPGDANSGWYVGAGLGGSQGSTLDQEGWNREGTCYPDEACFDQTPIPAVSGYRWRYDIDLDTGASFEIFAGHAFGRARLELAIAQERNNANQLFKGISYYDGTAIAPRPGGTVTSVSQAHVDNFNARSVLLNAYYDFPGAWGEISPYVGVGLGVSSLEISGVHFSSDYRDSAGEAYDPPLSFYNSTQNGDFSETKFSWRLYAGADYDMGSGLLLGVKLAYAASGDFEDTGTYDSHPFHQQDPNLSNTNRFGGPRNLTLAVTVKRMIGR